MDALQSRIGYQFQDVGLLALALTHPSVIKSPSNQRLEFLGDAILGAVVAHLLYTMYPNEAEGNLALRHAALVRGETLTQVARSMRLSEVIRVTEGEKLTGGQHNASNLEDALEALIGALYLDGGIQAAENFILPHWTELAKSVSAPPKDAKTALQEWAQGRGLPVPSYALLDMKGAAHAPEFTMEVTVQGHAPISAKAASKRAAEQKAAAELLGKLES